MDIIPASQRLGTVQAPPLVPASANYGSLLTIPFALSANGTIGSSFVVPAQGTFFYVVSLTAGQLWIQPNNDGPNPFNAGQGNNVHNGTFNFVTLQNRNAYAVTGTIVIGTSNDVGFIDKRFVLVVGAQTAPLYTEPQTTFPVGSNMSSINATSTLSYPGTGQSGPRAQIIMRNLDLTLNLNVLDGTGNLFYTILPQESFTTAAQGTFTLQNLNARSLGATVGEIYFNS